MRGFEIPSGKHIVFSKGNLEKNGENLLFASAIEKCTQNAVFDNDFVQEEQWRKYKNFEKYRLLTEDEWKFILENRDRYINVEIMENNQILTHGLILCPNVDMARKFFPDEFKRCSCQQCGIDVWRKLDLLGAVFLPASDLSVASGYWINGDNEMQIGTFKEPYLAFPHKEDGLFVRLVYELD